MDIKNLVAGKSYKVLVRCNTYNQSQYITTALNGFAMQITDFPFICVVMDDCSTDGEQAILEKYIIEECIVEEETKLEDEVAHVIIVPHKTNKHCIFVFYFLKENLYKHKEIKASYIKPWQDVSKYEAFCEGDDYWIDHKKLQKQVEFLEANPTIGMCYTKCRYFYQNQSKFAKKTWGGRAERFEELIKNNTIPTPSVVYLAELRSKYDKDINPYSRGWMLGDYPFWLWISKEYGVKFIDEETCVYRVLDHSASQRDNIERREAFISSVAEIQHFFADRYGQGYLVKKDKLERALLMDSFSNKDYKRVIRCYQTIKKPGLKATLKYLISLLLARRG